MTYAKTITRIQDLAEELQLPAVPDFPRIADMLEEEDLGMIAEAFKIISEYRTQDLHDMAYSRISGDIIRLQAIQASLSLIVGHLEKRADAMLEYLNMCRANLRNQLRKKKAVLEDEGTPVRGTVDEIRDIADEYAMGQWEQVEHARIRAGFARYAYYGIRDTVHRLDNAINRLFDER